ncbi:hypothetical protein Tco_0431830 [Tanacetum coccineum]
MSTLVVIRRKMWSLEKRKITLVDDEGKPLKKIDYPDDLDSEDEVALVDNELASFLASERVGYGQEIPDNMQSICDNLDPMAVNEDVVLAKLDNPPNMEEVAALVCRELIEILDDLSRTVRKGRGKKFWPQRREHLVLIRVIKLRLTVTVVVGEGKGSGESAGVGGSHHDAESLSLTLQTTLKIMITEKRFNFNEFILGLLYLLLKANMNESVVEHAWRLQDLEAKDVVVAQAQTRKDILKSSSKREINHMAERKYLVKFMSTILPSLRAKFPALLVTGEDLYVRPNATEELVKGAFSLEKGIGHNWK